jgi:hypothetical protein
MTYQSHRSGWFSNCPLTNRPRLFTSSFWDNSSPTDPRQNFFFGPRFETNLLVSGHQYPVSHISMSNQADWTPTLYQQLMG